MCMPVLQKTEYEVHTKISVTHKQKKRVSTCYLRSAIEVKYISTPPNILFACYSTVHCIAYFDILKYTSNAW